MPTEHTAIALVTGANRGIGLEIARQLGKRGMAVYVEARDEGRGIAAAEQLQGEGLVARFVELDVLREETIRAAAAAIEAAHGRLDVLVNNAGIADRGDGPPSRADHFGWLAHFLEIDCPASSEWTQKQLGWRPRQPGLLPDLDRPSYFDT